MYTKIVVPLDGSEVARQVLPYATMTAKALGASIELVEVVGPFPRELMTTGTNRPRTGAYPPSVEEWKVVQSKGREAALRRLEGEAGRLREAGLAVHVRVLEGDPARAITQAAREAADSLIALCTHGRSGVARWVLGSVTDKVVRTAERPVLVVRAIASPRDQVRISHVVLPLDGTEPSEAAVPHAVEIAKGLGVGITVLRSVSPLVYGDTFADYVPAMYQDLTAEVDREVRDYLRGIAERIAVMGVGDVSEEAPSGYPANTVLEAVGDAGEGLVVMSTHARSGVERWVLGSVTDRVIRQSPGPVLVVHPKVRQEVRGEK